MELKNYSDLIKNIPASQQCFSIKRENKIIEKAENTYNWYKEFNDSIFKNKKIITLNRNEVFLSNSIEELIIKTIYWGYPRGMRGNNFINILKNFNELTVLLSKIKNDNLNEEAFRKTEKDLKSFKGLGMSTYTKLLYFSKVKVNNAYCLILDNRIKKVIDNKNFYELNNLSQHKYDYLKYIYVINKISTQYSLNPENIELFLFIFGNNLKST